jgi:formamidopyrimidine-DNA glycosylase
MGTVAVDFSDPPAGWFYHQRWTANGRCPRCAARVKTATIGGRTTRWCPRCQR